MGYTWVLIGRGCSPTTPRHFCVSLCENTFVFKNNTNIMDTSTGRKTGFVEHDKHTKDAHRHDSDFDGPMTSPSSIWSSSVKKKSFDKQCWFDLYLWEMPSLLVIKLASCPWLFLLRTMLLLVLVSILHTFPPDINIILYQYYMASPSVASLDSIAKANRRAVKEYEMIWIPYHIVI